MRPALLSALVIVSLALGIPGIAKPPSGTSGNHPKGDMRFERGEYRLAARAYRSVLQRDPFDYVAMFGLARSLAAVNDCGEPLELLAQLRRSPIWSPETAALEGACRAAAGDFAGAEVAFEEAMALGGEPRGVLARVARMRLVAGDVEGFEAALEALAAEEGTDEIVAVLRAREAVERGLPDLEERLAEASRWLAFRPRGDLDGELYELEGRAWLGVDEPDLARPLLVEAVKFGKTDPTVAAWSLEAARRQGDPERARAGSERAGIKRAEGALIDAVRARILVDVGEVAEAEAALAALPDVDHPDVLASRWYVARARADEAAAARWADRWSVVENGGSRLDLLIPVWQRR